MNKTGQKSYARGRFLVFNQTRLVSSSLRFTITEIYFRQESINGSGYLQHTVFIYTFFKLIFKGATRSMFPKANVVRNV